jgi:hypothetical protein
VSYNSETNKTKDEGEKREIEEKKQTNKENNRERCAAKSLKEGKKKSLVQEQWNFRLSSSGVTPLASRPICLCLLGRFGALLWWVADGQSPTGLQAGSGH